LFLKTHLRTGKGFTGASPVSLTPVKIALPVTTTPVKLTIFISYYWPISMTPVRHDVTGVNDTGNECIPVIVDTGEVLYKYCSV
jgi:hypothetical protein